MKIKEKIITRRNFMKGTAIVTLGAITGMPVDIKTPKTKVVLIRDENVLDSNSRVQANIIQQMLDKAITHLFNIKDPIAAWRSIIKPEDIVGIKSNVWSYLPTPIELEQAVKRRIMDAGVSEKNISIDDRGILRNPIFKKATALINMRPARTHHWSGIGGCIKNYIMFTPIPSAYHGDSCADLAKVWSLPIIKGKTRLNILSVLKVQYHGRGPHHFDRRYVWNYKGLIISTDPVAVDTIGLKIIQAKRLDYFGEERNLHTTPHHVMYADSRHHLGTSDLNKIELIKLGWQEEILI